MVLHKKYLSRLEDSLDCRHLIERFGLLHTTHKSKRAFCRSLNKLDKQSKDIMINLKKNGIASSLGEFRSCQKQPSGFTVLRYIVLFFATMENLLEIKAKEPLTGGVAFLTASCFWWRRSSSISRFVWNSVTISGSTVSNTGKSTFMTVLRLHGKLRMNNGRRRYWP